MQTRYDCPILVRQDLFVKLNKIPGQPKSDLVEYLFKVTFKQNSSQWLLGSEARAMPLFYIHCVTQIDILIVFFLQLVQFFECLSENKTWCFFRPEADSLNKKVWAQTELWGKSVPDLKIAFFKKSLVLAGTKLSMGLAWMHSLKKI